MARYCRLLLCRLISSRFTIISFALTMCFTIDGGINRPGPLEQRAASIDEPHFPDSKMSRDTEVATSFPKDSLLDTSDAPAPAYQPQPQTLAHMVKSGANFAINGPSSVCKTGRNSDSFLIWVYSSPGNAEARQRVRDTWGSVREVTGVPVHVIFILGSSPTGDDDSLLAENAMHGDIVQDVSYIDSYANLSLKGASGLRWISKYCSAGKFAVKVDDDTLVSPFALVLLGKYQLRTNYIFCKLQVRVKPQRKADKWFEDPRDFPLSFYPNYCQGFAYILPIAVVPRLVAMIGKTLVPRMEDAYVTGVLPQVAGVRHKHLPEQYWLLRFPNGYERDIDKQTKIVFVSDTFIPSRQDYFWKKQQEIYHLHH